MLAKTFGDRVCRSELPARLEDFTTEELVTVLEPLGKVYRWQDKMPLNFRFARHSLDDRTPEQIVGHRLKQAREALGMDIETFYAPASMTKKTALKWEAGTIASHFIAFGERRFKALAEAHGIPEWWLLYHDRFEKDNSEEDERAA